jgi:hypothetical protein
MSCDQFTDLFELYAIGSLEKESSESLRMHLDSGCAQCLSRLDEALTQSAFVSSTVPLVEPPPGLRDRIAASVGAGPKVVAMPLKKPRPPYAAWLVAAASLAALVTGMGYEERARRSESESFANRTVSMLSILQAPGTRQVAFNINESNLPHGSLFIHKKLGVAMVVANMPAPPAGSKYETWIVPKTGAPRPVESFVTDNTGFGFTVIKGPVDVDNLAAVAVSLEPKDSTPVKPTKVLFASKV